MGMKADGNLYIAAQFLDTFDEIGKQVEKGAAKISNNTKIDLSLDEKNILKDIDKLVGSVKFKDLDLSDVISSAFSSISKEGVSKEDRTRILDNLQTSLRIFHTAPFTNIKQLKGANSEDLTNIIQEIQTDFLSDTPKRKWTSVNLKNNVKEIISEKLRATINDATGGIQETLIEEFGKGIAKYGVSEKEANTRLNNIYDSLVEKAKEQSKIEGNNVELDEIVTDNELKSIQGFYSRIESLGEIASDKAKKLADMLTSMSNDGAIEEGLDDIIYQISEDVNSFTEREKQLIQETKQQQKEIDELNVQNKSSFKQKIKPNFNAENQEQDTASTIFQSAEKENKIQETKTQQQENKKIIEQANEITATESKTVNIKKQQTQEIEKQNNLLKEHKQIEDNTGEVDEYQMAVSQSQVQQEIQETASTTQSATDSNKQLAESIQEVTQAIQQEEQILSKNNDSIMYHFGDFSKNRPSHQFGDEKRAWFKGIEDSGRGWADGTGTYVSNHLDEYSPAPISDKSLLKFYSIDVSKLKLYEAHTEEQAEQFYNFIHRIEQYCIKIGSGFEGFDDNLKNIDAESLYKTFQKVFPEAEMTVEQFNDFISRMSALVSESSLDKEGNFNPQKMYTFKKKYGIDDIKTRLLKELGYQGTNLSGTSYGGLQSGNVLFDDYAKIFTITSGKQLSEVAKQSEEIIKNRNEILKKRGINLNSSDLIGLTPEQLKQINDLLLEIYNSENRLSTIQKGSKIESAINDKITLNKNKIQEIIDNKNNQSRITNQEIEKNIESAKEELKVEQQLTNELKESKSIKQSSEDTFQKDNKESELQTIKEIKEETQQVAEQQQKVAEAKQETVQAAQEELKIEQQLSNEVQKQEKTEEKKPKGALLHKDKKLANVQKHGKSQAEIDAQIKAEEEKKKKKFSTPKSDLDEKKKASAVAAADAKAEETETINNLNFMAALRAKLAEAEAQQTEKEAQKIQVTSEQMQKLKQGIQEATDSLKEYKEIDEQIIKLQSDKDAYIISPSTQNEMMQSGVLSSSIDMAEYIRSAYRTYKKTGNKADEDVLKEALRQYMLPTGKKNGEYAYRDDKYLYLKNGKELKSYTKDKDFKGYIKQAQDEETAYEKAQRKLPALLDQKKSGQQSFVEISAKIQQLLQEAGLDAEKVNEILAAINGNLTNEEAIWKVINSYIKEATQELVKQEAQAEITSLDNLVTQQEKNQESIQETIDKTKELNSTLEQSASPSILSKTSKPEKEIPKILKTSEISEDTLDSAEAVKEESNSFKEVEETADKAAKAKNNFVNVNKSVKKSAKESTPLIKKESTALEDTPSKSEVTLKDVIKENTLREKKGIKSSAEKWINSGITTDRIERLKDYRQRLSEIEKEISNSSDQNKIAQLNTEYKNLLSTIKILVQELNKANSKENAMLKSQQQQVQMNKSLIDNRASLANEVEKKLNKGYYDSTANKYNKILSQYSPTESPEAGEAIGKANEALDKYTHKISELKKFSIGELQLDYPFEQLIQEINEAELEVGEFTKNVQDNFSKIANSNSVTDFATRIRSILDTYKRITPESKQKLENIFGSLTVGKTTTKQLADARTQLKSILTDEKELGNLSSNLFDRMYGKMQEGLAFLATKVSVYEIFNQFRQGLEIIHQFDDALTEMMKVSDETRLSLERYQKTTFDTADAIGTNALQLQNSTADFMRLGETLDQAAESAKTANVLMNVSEFQSIDEATKSLIAMSAAYDDLSKTQIIDKLNEVGNNFSISTSGAAEALQASASALKTAGKKVA